MVYIKPEYIQAPNSGKLCCGRERKAGENFPEAGRVSILNSECMLCGRECSGDQGQGLGEQNFRHREQCVQMPGAEK